MLCFPCFILAVDLNHFLFCSVKSWLGNPGEVAIWVVTIEAEVEDEAEVLTVTTLHHHPHM